MAGLEQSIEDTAASDIVVLEPEILLELTEVVTGGDAVDVEDVLNVDIILDADDVLDAGKILDPDNIVDVWELLPAATARGGHKLDPGRALDAVDCAVDRRQTDALPDGVPCRFLLFLSDMGSDPAFDPDSSPEHAMFPGGSQPFQSVGRVASSFNCLRTYASSMISCWIIEATLPS